jgi:pimeloyl-ACP methyl ester carboxylesterase
MIQRLRPIALLAAALLLGSVVMWAAPRARASSAPALTAAYSVKQVTLRTVDGVLLDGILYQPAAHPHPAAFLLVHGFGGNFYEAFFPPLAQAVARQGYVCLALNMRDHDTGPKVSDFRDNEADIAAGAAYLRKLGFPKLVLLGHSMGTNRVLYFHAATRDSGTLATVLVAGPGNLFQWNVWQFGQEKAQTTVSEALKLQAAGQEQQLMLVDLGPLGKALYTARYLLSLRGPDARSDPYKNIQNVSNPILIVQGTADRLVEQGIADRLKRAAKPGVRVDLIYLDGADHAFKGQEAVLAQRILAWLKDVVP